MPIEKKSIIENKENGWFEVQISVKQNLKSNPTFSLKN